MALKLNSKRVIGMYATQDYGKTVLLSWLAEKYAEHMKVYIYDTNWESVSKYPKHPNIFFLKSKNPSMQDSPEFFNKTLLYLRGTETNFFMVIEDVDKILNSARSDDNAEINKLASDSRHQRIAVAYATKEPTNIPVKLRSNTNLFYFGQFSEPAHLKAIGQMVNPEKVKRLSKESHEFIQFDRWTGKMKKVSLENEKLRAIEELQ